MQRFPLLLLLATAFLALGATASAQWDPDNAEWGKQNADHVRVMTWNVADNLCSTEPNKTEGATSWSALARIVAALQPDVLVLQETGDNDGNGTGFGVDSAATLLTVMDLFVHGGTDPWYATTVDSYVTKYTPPGYDLPYVYASGDSDGFNRNVVLSRFPFQDLNGDSVSNYSDIPIVLADAYAPGGDGGIRGFGFAEIDLPDGTYSGDLVVGNAHLKSGGSSSDQAQRLEAAQNVAYVVDYWYNGAGTGTPDPNSKLFDSPPATQVLAADDAIVLMGDWNEDEDSNGRKGPAEWLIQAAVAGGTDGTDRDRSDMTRDSATHVYTGDDRTTCCSKLDYVTWTDSVAAAQTQFVFNTSATPVGSLPAVILNHPAGQNTSAFASDHRPVVVDLEMLGSLEMTLAPPDPGLANQVNDFVVTNATPGNTITYYYGVRNGSTAIPGCPSIQFDFRNAKLFGGAAADGSGTATLSLNVPNKASNRTIFLQALDGSLCELTDRVDHFFP